MIDIKLTYRKIRMLIGAGEEGSAIIEFGISMGLLMLMLLGMALVMGGIQFIATGLIGEMLARTYYESQGRHPYAIRDLVNFDRPLIHKAAANDEDPPVRKAA